MNREELIVAVEDLFDSIKVTIWVLGLVCFTLIRLFRSKLTSLRRFMTKTLSHTLD